MTGLEKAYWTTVTILFIAAIIILIREGREIARDAAFEQWAAPIIRQGLEDDLQALGDALREHVYPCGELGCRDCDVLNDLDWRATT